MFKTLKYVSGVAATSVIACVSPAQAEALTDAQIIGIYIQVNSFDIETALLGRSQGSSSSVRTLAQQVSSDHMAVRQAAFDIAEKCKVAPSLPAERNQAALEQTKALARLSALKGMEFDKAYKDHEVAFHAAAIEAVKTTLLPAARCPELVAHFKAVLPAFEHHAMQTKSLSTGTK